MHRGYKYLSTLFLTAALAAPVAMMASAGPQENRDQKDQESRQPENNKRYYDEGHKDYHTWDGNEDRAYQQYRSDHHEKRDFAQLSSEEQSSYWTWRHNNPDKK